MDWQTRQLITVVDSSCRPTKSSQLAGIVAGRLNEFIGFAQSVTVLATVRWATKRYSVQIRQSLYGSRASCMHTGCSTGWKNRLAVDRMLPRLSIAHSAVSQLSSKVPIMDGVL